MPQRCDVCGKGPAYGHRISHAHNVTNRRFNPNLQQVTFYSEALKHNVGLRVTTRATSSLSNAS